METRPLRMLSGKKIVERGKNVSDCSLPEIGLKEVTPNNSWLETKQIQSALETRKKLVAAERIDKVGSLSLAEWRNEQGLAEVTQQVGGHWQYLGHNINGILYLLPEETLFLMETNCLLLKHNHVTVSLQKAYNMLLNKNLTLTQYKVYASLSRVGHKVFRHNMSKLNISISSQNETLPNTLVGDVNKSPKVPELSDNNTGNMTSRKSETTSNKSLPHAGNANECSVIPLDVTITSGNNTLNKSEITLDESLPPTGNVNKRSVIPIDVPLPFNNDTKHETTFDKSRLPAANVNGSSVIRVDEPIQFKNNTSNDSDMKLDKKSLPSTDESSKILIDLPLPSDNGTTNKSELSSDIRMVEPLLSKNDTSNKSEMTLNKKALLSADDVNESSDILIDVPVPSDNETPNLLDTPLTMDIANEKEIIEDNGLESACPRRLFSIDNEGVVRFVNSEEVTDIETKSLSAEPHTAKIYATNNIEIIKIYKAEHLKTKNRKVKPSDPNRMQERFRDIPDCYNLQEVTVKVPREKYLPRNVFLNKSSYVLNIQILKSSRQLNSSPPPLIETRTIYRTCRNSVESERAVIPPPATHMFSGTPILQEPLCFVPGFRPLFHPYLPRLHIPRHNSNRNPYLYNTNWRRTINDIQNTPENPRLFNLIEMSHNRRILNRLKADHLRAITDFALRLKQYPVPPNNSLISLNGLMRRFNDIYKEKMLLTPNLDVIDENLANVETIELEDDEKPTKKPRSKYDKYLSSVKALAARLKNVDRKKQSATKKRRAFCNLLKHFNETFGADFHLDSKGALVDKKVVVVDSSSDSDAASDCIEVTTEKKRRSCDNYEAPKNKKRKVFPNPFSVLKDINEGASTSRAAAERAPDTPDENNPIDLSKYVPKNWLPDEDDFGSAALCDNTYALRLLSDSTQLYDFMTDSSSFQTWVDLKLSFFIHKEAISSFEQDMNMHSKDLTPDHSGLKPLLQRNQSHDWPSLLNNLRVIKSDTSIEESSLSIDFDVFNRDVLNFRKTDPPKPHFRVVCIDASSRFPSSAEIGSIQKKQCDNVTTVFAVVGIGSVTYLQMNSTELPIYLGDDDDNANFSGGFIKSTTGA